jgi:PKD repeat protein
VQLTLTVTAQPMILDGAPGHFTGRLTGTFTPTPGPAAPVADFRPDTLTPDVREDVHLADASTGPITSWLWDFGDGGGSNLDDMWHAWGEPGVYTVRLTVTGPGGTSFKERVITVGPGAGPVGTP